MAARKVRKSKRVTSAKSAPPEKVLRVLDANLNRAREGLRVLEDTARFLWDAPILFRSFRAMRHQLDKVTRRAYPALVGARNSGDDPGRVTPEKKSRDQRGLVIANFRRAQEALRVLEEYGKVVSPPTVGAAKKIRFQLYTLEKKVLTTFLS